MSDARPPRRILRRIGAVFAGLVVVAVLDLGIDSILHATGVYPPWFQPMSTRLWLLAIGYRTVDGITGGYVAARLAPDRPVTHALVLGGIGIVLSTLGVIGTLEQRTGVWAQVVSLSARGDRAAMRLDRWNAP
ncbi:MAG: hypothetical protein ACRD9S_16960 [Pyrinomonadaceae bacterium]